MFLLSHLCYFLHNSYGTYILRSFIKTMKDNLSPRPHQPTRMAYLSNRTSYFSDTSKNLETYHACRLSYSQTKTLYQLFSCGGVCVRQAKNLLVKSLLIKMSQIYKTNLKCKANIFGQKTIFKLIKHKNEIFYKINIY